MLGLSVEKVKKRRASRYALTLCPISKHVLARHPVKGWVVMGVLIGVSSVHLGISGELGLLSLHIEPH